jgi:hypothetical protein
MGGFLANLGSGLAGAGAAAAPYREQVLNRWERHKEAVTNQLSQLIATESDPEKRSNYIQHLFDVNNLKVGQDPSKILKDLNETFMPHPVVTQGLGDKQGKPQPVQPGPATGGAAPGTLGTAAGPQTVAPASPMAGLIAGPQAAPAPPNAAQAPSSPVSPASQAGELTPMPGTIGLGMGPGNAIAPLATPSPGPAAAPPLPPVSAAGGGGGAPAIQDSQAIVNRYMSDPRWAAPTNRPILQAAMQRELEHNEALRQTYEQREFELGTKRKALAGLKGSEGWAALAPQMKAQYELWAATPGSQIPGMSPALFSPQVSRADAGVMSPEAKRAHGIPEDATGPYWTYVDKLTQQPLRAAEPAGVGSRPVDIGGSFVNVSTRPGALPTGAVPLTNLNERSTGVDSQGHTTFQTGDQLRTGGVGAGVNPSFVPVTTHTTTQVPGQLPTVSSHTSQRGGAAAPGGARIAPVGAGGGASTVTPAVKQWADDITNGRSAISDVPAREKDAVQSELRSRGLSQPERLSAKGQSDLASIDPVLKQIQDLKKGIEDEKLQNNNTAAYFTKEYQQYKRLGLNTPHSDLFTNLSFEGLRSTAAALKGLNSRALPILNKAGEHAPILDRMGGLLPDSPKAIYQKLTTMEGILRDGRQMILNDERKSGVVKPVEGDLSHLSDAELLQLVTGGKK